MAVMMAAPMDGGTDCNYDVSADGMAALTAIIIAALIVDWRRGRDGSADCNYDGNASLAALIAVMMAASMDVCWIVLLGGRRDCFLGSGVRVEQSLNRPWWHVINVGVV